MNNPQTTLERDYHGNLVTPSDVHPTEGVCGMSLRDWFAGQAAIGILSNNALLMIVDTELAGPTRHCVAEYAYGVADAMLAAREKGQK